MDILATFPAVRLPGTALPEALPQKDSVSCATKGPGRPRSITILAVLALVTWAAVWWLERERGATQQTATMAAADAVDGESVTR